MPLDHRRGLDLQRPASVGFDVALAVDRVPEWIDNPAEEAIADWHRKHLAGALDLLALRDGLVVAQDHRADAVLVEVERHAQDPARELKQLLGHHRRQALDVRDAISGIDDRAHLFPGSIRGKGANVFLNRAPDVFSGDCQLCHGFSFFLIVDCVD